MIIPFPTEWKVIKAMFLPNHQPAIIFPEDTSINPPLSSNNPHSSSHQADSE